MPKQWLHVDIKDQKFSVTFIAPEKTLTHNPKEEYSNASYLPCNTQ